MDFLVRQQYSEQEKQKADLARTEFRRNRYTSGAAHLDDMIALCKALILCDSDARKFSHRKARYVVHPNRSLRRVQGNCDRCKAYGPATLFLHESEAIEQRRIEEKHRRAMEYAHIVAQ